ncbi:hypothetical protein O181_076542 [Austropuccinia psidii MF-1]|uniref:5'-3' DNA helicase ZGRF1-like N-terminal domain-containing protein n=1 Tax=Austropuccinia psidii MF-1 TaxID=1389203 RepID=A0A9Q3FEH2_9BASI|nr:hypothetical protein [Austropuccinia psidii MF-1]
MVLQPQHSFKSTQLTQSAAIKKYSCMYTSDTHKIKKVWHDGFFKMRHMNSKIFLISQDGKILAEDFLKISSDRLSFFNKDDQTFDQEDEARNGERGQTAYLKIPNQFRLDEDEEINLNQIEDSETTSSSFMVRIIDLLSIDEEKLPVVNHLSSKCRQELQKRKMEYLDQNIKLLAKRSKPNTDVTTTIMTPSKPPSTHFDPSQHPIPSSSSSKRKAVQFETRPFTSPLIQKSTPIRKPPLESFDSTCKTIKPTQTDCPMSTNNGPHGRDIHQNPKSKPTNHSPCLKSVDSKSQEKPQRISSRRTLDINWESLCRSPRSNP